MAVETLAGPYASALPFGHGLAGNLKVAFGTYAAGTVVVEDGDIRTLCKLPKNSLVIGGWVMAGDGDTGTETLDWDIGWAANGGGSATYVDTRTGTNLTTYTNSGASASATGFCNSGVLTGDAITDLMAAGSNLRIFPITTPLYFSEETQVQLEVNAPAATPASYNILCVVLYIQL